jgi:hypothetical protein
MKDKTIRIYYNINMPVGKYMDIVYLTDENGLSEPLEVTFTVEAVPPYDEIDENKYPYNMSLCAQVKIDEDYDTDNNDIVYAFYHNECVGMAYVNFDEQSNVSNISLTVHGNDEMNRKAVSFQLWRASTGKVFDLTANRSILFAHGYVYGCGYVQPIILSTLGTETQAINLNQGWNWISTYLNVTTPISVLNAKVAWTEGDLIKNPSSRQFSTYSEEKNMFVGTLNAWDDKQMYMFYSSSENNLRLNGDRLNETNKQVTLRGDGQWNALPCLFEQATLLSEALTDYYQYASPGDIVKAQNRFAYFSNNQRWEGDLQALRPGEGYLFRRMAPGAATVNFYNKTSSPTPKRVPLSEAINAFSNPHASTNMTMIAQMENGKWEMATALPIDRNGKLEVYVGDELAAVAEPVQITNHQTLYFLTIQSDKKGQLRFEIAGQSLTPLSNTPLTYISDAHYGSVEAPIILRPAEDSRPYKILEDNHVIIIRNGERYDVTGKKME